MSEIRPELRRQCDELVEDYRRCRFLVRAESLQLTLVSNAIQLICALDTEIERLAAVADEKSACDALCLRLRVEAMGSEAAMWVRLKRGTISSAWDDLVRAQNAVSATIAISPQSEIDYLRGWHSRLQAVEHLIFPGQIFLSAGGIAKSMKCSICGLEYDECDHVEGRCYLGKLCNLIVTDYEAQEVSVVDAPGDKRCRATTLRQNGETRDFMTWEPIAEPSSDREPDDDQLRFAAIIMAAPDSLTMPS